VLQNTVLGANLGEDERALIEASGNAFLTNTVWKLALTSLKLPAWLPHPNARRMDRAGRSLRQVAERVLERTRQNGAREHDLIGRLVLARDPATSDGMPDDLIVDNVVTFLMAGHETTAQALTWTLYLLALFPEWQERLREEATKASAGRTIGRDQIALLPVLDGVFQEAMRLYPPAPTLMRRTSAPVRLGGIDVAEGATIVIPIYVVHRHRLLWRDPLSFDPSRFAPEERARRHRCAYMPFSTGPRSCIGASFAFAEAKTMLATLLARARFELPDGEAPTPFARITLRPKEGLRLKVTRL
jgi:cytochrome P450